MDAADREDSACRLSSSSARKVEDCHATAAAAATGALVGVAPSERIVARERRRHRRPDRMSRACTLLACGWSLQSWGTEGFAGMASGSWRPSGGGTVRPRPKTLSSSCCAAAGWQRRPPRRVLGDYCGASVACRQAMAASTLDWQEDGALVDEGSSSIDGEGVDAAAAAAVAASSKPSKKGRNGKRNKTIDSTGSGKKNKLFDLLNGLEGGGGGGLEARELLGISEEGMEEDEEGGAMMADDGTLDAQEDVGLAISDEEEEEEDDDVAAAAAGLLPGSESSLSGVGEGGQLMPFARRRLRIRLRGPVPPLTRSQTEEERVLPTAKLIQELSRDKRNETNWTESMNLLKGVKEEHGERGLGLTHIYKVGMKSCLDFNHPEDALRLFNEAKAFKDSPPNRQCFDMAILAHCLLEQRDEAMDTIVDMKEAGYEPTERTYNHVLRACRETEGGAAVADRAIALYAEEEGLDIDGLLPRNLALCHSYLMVLALANEWEQAVELFWSLVERGRPAPDTACYDAALLACRRSGRWSEALDVLDHARREDVAVEPTSGMYMLAMMTMLWDDEEESDAAVMAAVTAWEEFRQTGMLDALRPNRMAALLHALFAACVRWEALWPKAIEVFGIMSDKDDVAPTAREYRSMLHMLSLSKDVPRGGNWARSVELLKEAQEMEYRLTEVSFRTVIADLGFAGEVDKAFEIFDDMRMTGVPPTITTYNRLLGVCEKNGEVERTFKMMDEMYEAEISPTVVSFCSAISACGKGLQWRRALALLVRMQHDEIMPNLQCLNAAIHALGLSGEWRRADAIMEVIWKSGMTPDVVSYNSIAMAYASAGEADRALEVLETMRSNGVDPDEVTFGTLLTACEGENAFSIMRALMDDMDQMGIKKTVIHFSAAIDAANRMEETGMAWELWRLMGVGSVEPNNYAYSSIITTAAIDRDVRTALKLLEEMKKKEISIDVVTYTSAICACGPDWLLALDVLDDMAEDGVPPNLLSYTAAMGACLKGEEYREAVAVFARMKNAGIAPDLRAYNLAMMAHENDGNHYGRIIVEAEMQEANLVSQDRDWETGWQPPPDAAQGGFDEW